MLAIRDAWQWRVAAAAGCLALTALAPHDNAEPTPRAPPDCIQRREPSRTEPPPHPTRAIFDTDFGRIACTLDRVHAPATVANFVKLARNHFYDALTFHRVIPGFMIQGGDPNGTGTGGPGYELADEIAPDLAFDHPGVLAMANRGKDTNGSQFFITDAPARWLDHTSTIFGTCGQPDVVHAIASVPRTTADRPIVPVYMVVTLD